jgi:hypothetical protein
MLLEKTFTSQVEVEQQQHQVEVEHMFVKKTFTS